MKGDFTRNTFNSENHFIRVLMQQGRVQLDADWNEQASIMLHYLQALAQDIIGPYGGPTSNCGFSIIIPDNTTFDDIERERLTKLGLFPVTPGDFLLGKGHYYVDSILCENEDYTLYSDQPDWSPAKLTLTDGSPYLLYLDVWERHITVVENPDIREVALGGPDTATRAKVVWQVKTEPLEEGASCDSVPWDELVETWQPTNRGRLKARTNVAENVDETDPCITPPEARYRGAENQLYRVEIHGGGPAAEATFKWSRDNGTVVFPIRSLQEGKVVLNSMAHDSRLSLKVGDWVEILDDNSVRQGNLGFLLQVDKIEPMDTTVEPVAMTVTLNVPAGVSLPAYDEKSSTHPLLRRWDYKPGNPEKYGAEQAEDYALQISEESWIHLEDGVYVQFQPSDPENQYRPGDYWLIPARTATGDVEWPQEENWDGKLAPKALPPHGVEHHYAPLAIISVADGTVTVDHDCRCSFNPLGQDNEELRRRTIADMRDIGTALGSYQVDQNGFPIQEQAGDWKRELLSAQYYQGPIKDAWGTPFQYQSDGTNYKLTSYGSDKKLGGQGFAADIIYENGQFTAPPDLV